MASKCRPSISGLDRFGHTLSTIGRLGDRLVTLKAAIPPAPYVYPRPSTYQRLVKKTPSQRAALSNAWRSAKVAKLRNELPAAQSLSAYRFGSFLAGLRFTMHAKDVHFVIRLRHAESVEVTHVAGLRPRSSGKRADGTGLYAVKGRLAVQYEGQRSGLQQYEDRVVVVAARTEKAAAARVARLLRSEEAPVLMGPGYFMRHHFEGILEVLECADLAGPYPVSPHFNPLGTEVWWELRRRRLPKGQVWRPT